MAGNFSSSNYEDDAPLSDINVTPLVDVTLVLLIVFMITVPAIVGSAPVKVELPESTSIAAASEQLPLVFSLKPNASGELEIFLNERSIDEAGIRQMFQQMGAPNEGQPVSLSADKAIPYGQVIKFVDFLESLGLKKLSLDTRHVESREGIMAGHDQNGSPLPEAWVPPPRPRWSRRAAHAVRCWAGGLTGRFALPEEEVSSGDPLGRLVLATPPWFASLIVHFGLMILLGLIALEAHRSSAPSMTVEVELTEPIDEQEIYAETLGEQLEDPSVPFSNDGPVDESAALAISNLPPVNDPLAGPPMLGLSPGGNLPSGDIEMPAIGLALTGREAGMKDALLKAYGGTALTQEAVDEGLRWLARRQRPNGMWSMQGPYGDGANTENEEAATAMALLAFQGAGHTPQSSEEGNFKRAVTRGWRALLRRQQPDGRFYGDVATGQRLYTQAQCTIALCELFGMTRDESYRDAAQRAVDYCVKIQSPEGGWRYEPGIDSDTSVTGWFVMALQSARMAGIEVPSPVFAKIDEFLDSVARDDGSKYAYRVRDGATLSLTAEGLLCRQYLGWKRDDDRLRNGVDYLLANLPEWDEQNVYYWYYATQVCHHMEGPDWQRWNEVTRQLLPEHQQKRGTERGSWVPTGDRWGSAGGRLYVTCLSLYILEVYYRHLPIYQNVLVNP